MPSPEARHRRPTVPLTGAPGSPGLRDPSAEARAPGTGARMTGERRTGVPGRGGPGYGGSGAGDRGANAGAEGTGERRVGYTGTRAMMPGRRVRGTGGSVGGKRGAITAAGRFSTGNPSFSTPIFFLFCSFPAPSLRDKRENRHESNPNRFKTEAPPPARLHSINFKRNQSQHRAKLHQT